MISEKDIISILSFDQIQLIETNINYNRPISAPINKGQKLGTMNIKIPGKQTIKVNLVAQESIGKINPLLRLFASFKYLIFGTSLDEI